MLEPGGGVFSTMKIETGMDMIRDYEKIAENRRSSSLRIAITTGVGEGPTPLAAFDAALLDAGIANYNLIYLSSVIPPGSRLERTRFVTDPEEYGHRLYVVMARHFEQQPGKMAWAGVGWTQNEEDRRGLFVELDGGTRAEVDQSIRATLQAMIAGRPFSYGPIESEIIGVECRTQPVCALVAAVYRSEGWTN